MFLDRHLTPNEREIARRIVRGESHRETCEKLGISPSRYKSHVRHILEKSHSQNQTEFVRRAVGAR